MYRILALDGGGMHGYATIVILRRLLQKFPKLLDNIDLVAGTSIGGILGLGIALGHDVKYVEDNFVRGIPLAFNTNWPRKLAFYAGFAPKYDIRKFKKFLGVLYQNKKLKDLKKKVLIPSFCLDDESPFNRRWKAKFFHNFPGIDSDEETDVLTVALATSAVPVFFPSYDKYIDGALVANSPALAAVVQAIDRRNETVNPTIDEISVLSIGTIRNIFIKKRNLQWGYFMWAKSLLQMFTERDTLVVNHMSTSLLNERYHRIEPIIDGPMDNFEALQEIGQIAENYPIDKSVQWLYNYWC